MSDCIIKSGESVEPSDPRLSDTACMIETGVIIRPPPDLVVAIEPTAQAVVEMIPPPRPRAVALPVTAPAPVPKPELIAAEVKVEEPKAVSRAPASVAYTAVPDHPQPVPIEDPGILNPTTAMVAVGAVAAVAGTAAAGSAMGGISVLQAKIASVFGTSKGAIATATVVTAGTIVAVKALEKKMNTLEKDLEKTKEEVGSAASSIDRIDALLDKLGN